MPCSDSPRHRPHRFAARKILLVLLLSLSIFMPTGRASAQPALIIAAAPWVAVAAGHAAVVGGAAAIGVGSAVLAGRALAIADAHLLAATAVGLHGVAAGPLLVGAGAHLVGAGVHVAGAGVGSAVAGGALARVAGAPLVAQAAIIGPHVAAAHAVLVGGVLVPIAIAAVVASGG